MPRAQTSLGLASAQTLGRISANYQAPGNCCLPTIKGISLRCEVLLISRTINIIFPFLHSQRRLEADADGLHACMQAAPLGRVARLAQPSMIEPDAQPLVH